MISPDEEKKCILLLPLKYNDGKEVPLGVLNKILRSIDEAFDGHTIAGTCNGVYKMDDGTLSKDRSYVVWVCVDSKRVKELKKMAAGFAAVLKQESLFFEVTESDVEFVRPLQNGGIQ